MSTAVLERKRTSAVKIKPQAEKSKPQFEQIKIAVDAESKAKAEVVLEQLGMSLSEAVDLFLGFVAAREKLPEVLNRPFIPSLDDMTEEEFDALIKRAFDQIEAGNYYTPEEIEKEIQARYEASLQSEYVY